SAQGLASILCGLGMMPYNAAIGRDLGFVPLRCLPDVLRDGGFDADLYYGSKPSFDNVDEFLRYHGFSALFTEEQLPRRLARGLFGRTDLAVFDYALEQAERWDPERPRYVLVLTVSNHIPFGEPQDLPRA